MQGLDLLQPPAWRAREVVSSQEPLPWPRREDVSESETRFSANFSLCEPKLVGYITASGRTRGGSRGRQTSGIHLGNDPNSGEFGGSPNSGEFGYSLTYRG